MAGTAKGWHRNPDPARTKPPQPRAGGKSGAPKGGQGGGGVGNSLADTPKERRNVNESIDKIFNWLNNFGVDLSGVRDRIKELGPVPAPEPTPTPQGRLTPFLLAGGVFAAVFFLGKKGK